MPQNLVSLDISADDLAAMDQAIATLETLTKPFITLSADDKSGLVKMGDKSVAFCQQTALVLAEQGDPAAHLRLRRDGDDLAAYAALQSRVLRIREVLAKMDDTQTALGSDVMVAASEGYALMKLFGKAEGLSELQQAMRVRRPPPQGRRGRRIRPAVPTKRRLTRLFAFCSRKIPGLPLFAAEGSLNPVRVRSRKTRSKDPDELIFWAGTGFLQAAAESFYPRWD
jgi:hypothetical protein